MVKIEPNHQCEASSELLFGETVKVLERGEQWCKVQSTHDAYEGYIDTASCEFSDTNATHRVVARATVVFAKPDIKSPIVHRLLFGSELVLNPVVTNSDFLQERGGGYVWSAHCIPIENTMTLPIAQLAQRVYLQAPYLWGGRSTDGCDCSGLVQVVAGACGINLPRDSGDQEQHLSSDVGYAQRAADDLVFWPGHVGLLKTPDYLVHATAHSMQCCIEPLDHVIQRAGMPSSIKRVTV